LATLVTYWRLAESSITVTSSVTCYVGWYNHMADAVLPSTASVFCYENEWHA